MSHILYNVCITLELFIKLLVQVIVYSVLKMYALRWICVSKPIVLVRLCYYLVLVLGFLALPSSSTWTLHSSGQEGIYLPWASTANNASNCHCFSIRFLTLLENQQRLFQAWLGGSLHRAFILD